MDDEDRRYSRDSESSKGSTNQQNPPKKTIYFRFGSRVIGATGVQSDWHHPNVLRLRLHESIVEWVIRSLLSLIPFAWIQNRFPEWTLPRHIVLKIQKQDWESEFETEKATYEMLRPLQGLVIPRYYGQIEYDGVHALILSDVGGKCVAEPEGAILREEELRPLLERALRALADHGVSHDDIKLDNFHLVEEGNEEKIMAVDFERVDVGLSEEDFSFMVKAHTNQLMRWYKGHLECLEHDGLLLPLKHQAKST